MKRLTILASLALLIACQPSQEILMEQKLDNTMNRMKVVKVKLTRCLELSKKSPNSYNCLDSFKEIQVYSEDITILMQEIKYAYSTDNIAIITEKQDKIEFHVTTIENILAKYEYL